MVEGIILLGCDRPDIQHVAEQVSRFGRPGRAGAIKMIPPVP